MTFSTNDPYDPILDEATFRQVTRIGSIVTCLFAAVWLAVGVWGLATVLGAGAVFMYLAHRLLPIYGVRGAAHFTIAITYLLILGFILFTGGFSGVARVWLFALPVAVALTVDARDSAAWAVAIAGTLLVLWLLEWQGVALPDVTPERHRPLLRLAGIAGALITILALSITHAAIHRGAVRRFRSSNANLFGLLRAIPEAIYAVRAERDGADFRCEFMNPAMVELLGTDLTGVRASELVAPADAPARGIVDIAMRQLQEVVQTGVGKAVRERIGLPHGERHLEIRLQPLHGENGEVSHVVSMVRDLADVERHAIRLEVLNDVARVLASSELSLPRFYEALYEQVGRVLRRDVFYAALWDERRSLFTLPVIYDSAKSYPAREIPLGEGPTSRALREARTIVWSNRLDDPRRGASVGDPGRDAKASIHAPMIHEGRVLGVLSVQSYEGEYAETDVSLFEALAAQAAVALENTRLYQRVKSSETRFRELLRAIERMEGHNVVVTDLEGVVTYAAGTEATHGYAPEEILGRPVAVLGENVEGAEQIADSFVRATALERPFTEVVQATRKDGTNFPIMVSASPYFDAKGTLIGVVTIGRDLTEQVENQRRLLQSARLASLGELIAGVAHEINNPLTIIKNTAALLEADTDGTVAEDARVIQESTDRAVKIVRNLLHFARQAPPERAATELNQVVERVVRFRQGGLAVNNVSVELRLMEDLPQIVADASQLEQVLLNLVNNAEQSMVGHRGGGRIAVSTAAARGMVRLTVEDTGPGIPRDVLPRIFDPFFTTRDVGEGTGLGLAVSHGIVSEHKGVIWAESEPGRGAKFIVELPIPGQAQETMAEPVEEKRSPQGKRILLVDDEDAIRRSVGKYLSRRGHSVVEAASGTDGLEQALAQPFDVILLDLKMPGMSGEAVYGALKERRPELCSRIIFATGDIASPSTRAFLESTGQRAFEKPFSLDEIAAAVEEDGRTA